MLVTLRLARAPLPYAEEIDPETAFLTARQAGWPDHMATAWAAFATGLELFDGAGDAIPWSMAEVRRLRFLRWLARRVAP